MEEGPEPREAPGAFGAPQGRIQRERRGGEARAQRPGPLPGAVRLQRLARRHEALRDSLQARLVVPVAQAPVAAAGAAAGGEAAARGVGLPEGGVEAREPEHRGPGAAEVQAFRVQREVHREVVEQEAEPLGADLAQQQVRQPAGLPCGRRGVRIELPLVGVGAPPEVGGGLDPLRDQLRVPGLVSARRREEELPHRGGLAPREALSRGLLQAYRPQLRLEERRQHWREAGRVL